MLQLPFLKLPLQFFVALSGPSRPFVDQKVLQFLFSAPLRGSK